MWNSSPYSIIDAYAKEFINDIQCQVTVWLTGTVIAIQAQKGQPADLLHI